MDVLITRYTILVFLYPVRSTGHIVRSGSSGVQNIDALFFILGWAWFRSHKKPVETRYTKFVFFQPVESTCHLEHSAASRV
jgi:hypothetical protein